MTRALLVVHTRNGSEHGSVQGALGFPFKDLRLDLLRFPGGDSSLLEDLANAFERNRQRFEVLRLANGSQGFEAFARIHQVVRAGTENGIHFVVTETFLLTEDELGALEQEVQNLPLLLGRDLPLRCMGKESLRGRGDRIRQGERKLLVQNDLYHAEAGAAKQTDRSSRSERL